MMNLEVKKLWLNALRSGKFKQARVKLYDDGAYCCLGVLCHLYTKSTGKKWKKNGYHLPEGPSETLPIAVMKWAGLNSDNPRTTTAPYRNVRISLVNDSGNSFEKIADIIERDL